jgi:hypothetical protein
MTIQGYDLVGDIHGHADALHRLLHKLDYAEVKGVFRHPERKMIFVADVSRKLGFAPKPANRHAGV